MCPYCFVEKGHMGQIGHLFLAYPYYRAREDGTDEIKVVIIWWNNNFFCIFATEINIINQLFTIMRKIRSIILATFAVVSMSASAQEPFGTVYLQYNPSLFDLNQLIVSHDGHSVSTTYDAISLGYNYATPMFGIPLFLEFGGAIQWGFKYKDNYKTNMLALKIPLNVVYSIDISDSFSILPYAGAYGRFNLLAKTKYDEKPESYDWFSDGDAKRFQIGLNAGCRFRINQFTIGAGYYYDLMKIEDHTHFEGFELTMGMVL